MVAGPGLAPHLGSAMAKMQEGEERLLGGVGETLLIWVLSLPPRTAEIQEEFGGSPCVSPWPCTVFRTSCCINKQKYLVVWGAGVELCGLPALQLALCGCPSPCLPLAQLPTSVPSNCFLGSGSCLTAILAQSTYGVEPFGLSPVYG